MVGSICSIKQFRTGSKFSQGSLKVTDDAQPGVEVAEAKVNTSVLWVLTQW
jgi:hypothetical protein